MSWLLSAVLLVILQAPPSAPQRAANASTDRGGVVPSQFKPKEPAPAGDNAVGNEARADSEPHSMSIDKLPPVTVVSSRRDWADWGYWVFSGLLVVVGALQVWLLKRTLGAIKEQANLMERQAKATEDAVTATRDNAFAAKDGAEAAKANADAAAATVKAIKETSRKELRARVFVATAARLGSVAAGPFHAEITIKNFGRTPAYGCTCAIELVLRPNPPDDSAFPAPRITGQEPKMVLPPNGQFTVVRSLPAGTFGNTQHSHVMAAGYAVFVYGEIRYRDGFGKKRFNNFLMKCCGADYGLGRFSFAEKGNKAN